LADLLIIALDDRQGELSVLKSFQSEREFPFEVEIGLSSVIVYSDLNQADVAEVRTLLFISNIRLVTKTVHG